MKTIKLTRYDTANPAQNQHVWPLKVVALGVEGAPSEVFVFSRAKVGDPLGDVFQCVTSVPQLDELPTSAPTIVDETVQIPFYRQSEASFNCRTAEEADTVWQTIQDDVYSLLRNLESVDDLAAVVAVDVTASGVSTTSP
jgi:hypothetical protein